MTDKSQTSAAPLAIAIGLLLLPMLYVGSYLSLVRPEGRRFHDPAKFEVVSSYRINSRLPGQFYWPLERIDRKVRPQAWRKQKVLYMLCPTSPLPPY